MTTEVTAVPRLRQQVLDAIADHVQTHGWAPTIRELAAACGTRSTSTMSHHLRALELSGHIRRAPGKPRTIQLLTPDGQR